MQTDGVWLCPDCNLSSCITFHLKYHLFLEPRLKRKTQTGFGHFYLFLRTSTHTDIKQECTTQSPNAHKMLFKKELRRTYKARGKMYYWSLLRQKAKCIFHESDSPSECRIRKCAAALSCFGQTSTVRPLHDSRNSHWNVLQAQISH